MDLVEKVKILNNHLKARNFSKVIEGCLRISKKIPNNSYILNLTGMAYQGLAQHKNAIYFFSLNNLVTFINGELITINNISIKTKKTILLIKPACSLN